MMVLTFSTMMPLGTKMPDFELMDVVTGQKVSPAQFSDKQLLLIMFICRHCPYVQHVKKELVKLANDYKDKGVGVIAISSNDAEAFPEDAPESLKEMALQEGFPFPLLYDEMQDVAKVFTAACTPDFFVFDRERKLVYRGQLDDSRPDNGKPVTGADLRAALDAVLSRLPVNQDQKPSSGCNIKWKAGNEPDYFLR